MKFSQRIGKTPVREALQVESMDERLQNKLWNCISVDFLNSYLFYWDDSQEYFERIWVDFLNFLVDDLPKKQYGDLDKNDIIEYIKRWYFDSKWYDKYDLLEFLCGLDQNIKGEEDFGAKCNLVLKKEMAGYRVVNNQITPITSEQEIIEIEKAFENTSKWDSVTTHLETSLHLLSNREKPDYTNSLKESVSAVESMCKIILGESKKGLGAYLSEIAKRYDLNEAVKKGFSTLYGHASNNARHGRSEDSEEITMAYARFMFISCSAFINYLMELEYN